MTINAGVPQIDLKTFEFDLPEERIAKFPLEVRDESKLLVFKNQSISHRIFKTVSEEIPQGSLLVFNNTKVIQARMLFKKSTGAEIEIFLLNPENKHLALEQEMQAEGKSRWKAMVGNAKRWKSEDVLVKQDVTSGITLQAAWANREEQLVEFSWNGNDSFAKVLEIFGEIPLPPYLKRAPEESDKVRYQTVYSKNQGAVAAPTAGLHFTENVFKNLAAKNISTDELTLHVAGGTFQPVKTENPAEHPMHAEQLIVSQDNIRNILRHDFVIPVGTTSMRTLESTYWFGVKLLQNSGEADFFIEKLLPYQFENHKLPSKKQAFEAVLVFLELHGLEAITGITEILILPSYRFRVCNALITNFHQPGTTLILLVAAFVGAENWKKIYEEALAKDYRFLSYGDSSLLFGENFEG